MFLVPVSSVLIACEPMIDISIHNRTDDTLQIFTGNSLIGKAEAGGKVLWKIESIQPKYSITAKDMDGNVVYSANFTRDDIKGKKTYDVYFPP